MEKILIVDDENDIAELISDILEKYEFYLISFSENFKEFHSAFMGTDPFYLLVKIYLLSL